MKIVKPDWVAHSGSPIYTIDIHPDGSRFATGGQGDATSHSGQINIWNMSPVTSKTAELDKKVPKRLCRMDNHLACVNCLRWSNSGKYLASSSDDRLVMIWKISRYGGGSSFGSSGRVENIEQWRCSSTLRGHAGDVLGVAWSPHDIWLASCSIDNNVIVWNANNFPEQVATLHGHKGMVKGVTWDPVGTFLASQSDDKTLRVWRTYDWKQEAVITKPFEECGGTTHILRLAWSPDGHYIVSAHAMNNRGPTAQIVERKKKWATNLDFVGHRKAVTCVRFNPNIILNKNGQQCACLAVGSKDRVLTVWSTHLNRPVVVVHEMFENAIMDLSWSVTGLQLLVSSYDGTVACLEFENQEFGKPLPEHEKEAMLRKTYGKILSARENMKPLIAESAEILALQKKKAAAPKNDKMQLNQVNKIQKFRGEFPSKQVETRLPNGKRRITPLFLPPEEECGEAPKPFGYSESDSLQASISLHSEIESKPSEESKPKEKSPLAAASTLSKVSKTAVSSVQSKMDTLASQKQTVVEKVTENVLPSICSRSSNQKKENSTAKRESSSNRSLRKRRLPVSPSPSPPPVNVETPAISKRRRLISESPSPPPPLIQHQPSAHQLSKDQATKSSSEVVRQYNLPAPSIQKVLSLDTPDLTFEIENNVCFGSSRGARLRCIKKETKLLLWEELLPGEAVLIAAGDKMICIICVNAMLFTISFSGSFIIPAVKLNGKAAMLDCNGMYCLVVTVEGSVTVWNVSAKRIVLHGVSVASLLTESRVSCCQVNNDGKVSVVLTTGDAFMYDEVLASWVCVVNDNEQSRAILDDFFADGELGPISAIHAVCKKVTSRSSRVIGVRTNQDLEKMATRAAKRDAMMAALSSGSAVEYKKWLIEYVTCLADESKEIQLREICSKFLGPVYKSVGSSWQSEILGVKKRDLLNEILPIIGSSLQLQRLYLEFKEQLCESQNHQC